MTGVASLLNCRRAKHIFLNYERNRAFRPMPDEKLNQGFFNEQS
jgi:hypothetical protein